MKTIEIDYVKKILPDREIDTHKGNYGRVFVIGAMAGMMGATKLAASAALRTGSGLVYIAASEALLPFYNILVPGAVIKGFPGDPSGSISASAAELLISAISAMSVIIIGPGLGISANNRNLILHILRNTDRPVILDADAIGNINPTDIPGIKARLIITPHFQEFSRFLSLGIARTVHHGKDLAIKVAKELDIVVVLKGPGTFVTDGEQGYVNTTGNPGMATAGAGDVLAGVIASLVGLGNSLIDSAAAGVFLHGMSGDIAKQYKGEYGMIASDIVEYMPDAILKVKGSNV